MTVKRILAPNEVGAILTRGVFDELNGSVEHEQFECKSGFYDLKSEHGKIELAKDVSALANSRGGYILIGVSTTRDPLHQLDEVVSVSPFGSPSFDSDQHRSTLDNLIFPGIRGLRIEWHPSATSRTKGIASIYVPAECRDEQPYLVAQTMIGPRASSKMIGFFERISDDALPTTVQTLRQRLKDGMRNREIDRRIENIESLLAKQLTSEVPPPQPTITATELHARVADATKAARIEDTPSFFLTAVPEQRVEFARLFHHVSRLK